MKRLKRLLHFYKQNRGLEHAFCYHRYNLNVSFQVFSFAFNISMNWEWGGKLNPYSLFIGFDPLVAKVGNDIERPQSA